MISSPPEMGAEMPGPLRPTRAKNAAMYKIGTEILSRYEKFGLGDVITRKEPFIGTTRVKFENLMQDFSDGLTDQKIKP